MSEENLAGEATQVPSALRVRGARYMGGHRRWPDPAEATFLSLSKRGLEFRLAGIPVIVAIERVESIDVLDEEPAKVAFETVGFREDLDRERGLHRTACVVVGTDEGTIVFATTPSTSCSAAQDVELMRPLFEGFKIAVNEGEFSREQREGAPESREDANVVTQEAEEIAEIAESEESEIALEVGDESGLDRCGRGHELPDGANFCPTCGEAVGVGIVAPARGVGDAHEKVKALRAWVLEGKSRLREMRGGDTQVSVGDPLADRELLTLRREVHELHVEVKRAELDLAIAEGEAGMNSGELTEALVSLRQVELEFASMMLLEVTELIAVPPDDDDGRAMVVEHLSTLTDDCALRRLDALLKVAQVRGEAHGIRAAELEVELDEVHRRIREMESQDDSDSGAHEAELAALKSRHAQMRIEQLEERKLASEALGDQDDARDASMAIELITAAREEAEADEKSRTSSRRPRKPRTPMRSREGELTVETLKEEMPGLFAERSTRSSNRQRLAVAKRFLSDFRAFFVAQRCQETDPEDELTIERDETWDAYDVLTRKLMALPIGSMHRGADGKRPQWNRSNELIVELATSRLDVVDVEIKVAEAHGDSNRVEVFGALREALVDDLERVREEISKSSGR